MRRQPNQTQNARMTKAHFELIAETLKTAPVDYRERFHMAEHFADTLARTNPLFARERFLAACQPQPLPRQVFKDLEEPEYDNQGHEIGGRPRGDY